MEMTLPLLCFALVRTPLPFSACRAKGAFVQVAVRARQARSAVMGTGRGVCLTSEMKSALCYTCDPTRPSLACLSGQTQISCSSILRSRSKCPHARDSSILESHFSGHMVKLSSGVCSVVACKRSPLILSLSLLSSLFWICAKSPLLTASE